MHPFALYPENRVEDLKQDYDSEVPDQFDWYNGYSGPEAETYLSLLRANWPQYRMTLKSTLPQRDWIFVVRKSNKTIQIDGSLVFPALCSRDSIPDELRNHHLVILASILGEPAGPPPEFDFGPSSG